MLEKGREGGAGDKEMDSPLEPPEKSIDLTPRFSLSEIHVRLLIYITVK